jgi:mono/diheme cytochrome c family protein
MRLQLLITTGMLACYCLLSSAQAPDASHAKTATQPVKVDASNPPKQIDIGEQKFQQNCNRCHNAPQELSRRITGTVVLHMRARASLSAADARAILHYLAP